MATWLAFGRETVRSNDGIRKSSRRFVRHQMYMQTTNVYRFLCKGSCAGSVKRTSIGPLFKGRGSGESSRIISVRAHLGAGTVEFILDNDTEEFLFHGDVSLTTNFKYQLILCKGIRDYRLRYVNSS